MNLDNHQTALLEQWLADESFLNWVNQANADDSLKWEVYFNEHPAHWELAKIGKLLVKGIPFEAIPKDAFQREQALRRLLGQVDEKVVAHQPVKKVSRVRRYRAWMAAASVTLLLFCTGAIYWQYFHNVAIVLATNYGEQLATTLPDGSRVTLNANSSLTYYSQNPRKTWLEGEAFFEVEKRPRTKEKFQVFTQDLTVTVLGTSFNVNSRNEKTKVFLEEGKVKLKLDNPTTEILEMKPGDEVAYSKKQEKIIERKKNASILKNASWKEGALIFKDTPLVKALYEIEDIYGIQFVLQNDELKEEIISGGVPIKNLKVTLQTLQEAYGMSIRAEGKRYFLSTKKEYLIKNGD